MFPFVFPQVLYSLYYSVFREDFNLGFGTPKSDKCATCEAYKYRVQSQDLTAQEKMEPTANFIIHRRKARKFYDLMNVASEDTITLCFDMMENQVLPKTPIGAAYYSRQLYLYIFGIVRHHGKNGEQSKNDVHFYTWLESENHKDSNMIASALQHHLSCRKAEVHSKTELKLCKIKM